MRFNYTGRLYAPEGVGGGGGEGGAPGGTPGEGAHPVVAPWAAAEGGAWKIGEGDTAKEWWETIPEPEAREHVKAKGYKNPAELALANYSLTKMQRGATDVISVPGKDADENAWNEFYTKMGRPAAPDDYKFDFGEAKVDDNMLKFGKTMFHEMGLSNDKAQKAAEKWNSFVEESNAQTLAAEQKANADAVTALEATWGADGAENRAAGERVLRALELDETTMAKIEGAIGAAPLIDLLARIGKKSSEGKLVAGGGGGDPNDPANMTKEQAAVAIEKLNGDAEFQKSYTDKNHPGHQEAVDKMLKLFAKT